MTIWSNTLFAQTSQDILGIWLKEEDAKIEVFIEDENADWRLDEKILMRI